MAFQNSDFWIFWDTLVIINNWGHIITFWGRGFIGGDYHYLGARLLATYSRARALAVGCLLFPWENLTCIICSCGLIVATEGIAKENNKARFWEHYNAVPDQRYILLWYFASSPAEHCPKTPGNFPQLSYFSICLILEARSPSFPLTEPPRTA